jgi:hypothetical protein
MFGKDDTSEDKHGPSYSLLSIEEAVTRPFPITCFNYPVNWMDRFNHGPISEVLKGSS